MAKKSSKGSKKAAKVTKMPLAKPPRKSSKPKDQPLPGMDDGAIQPLEDAAHEYARIRDERMDLSKEESSLKGSLLALMKKYNKAVYRHAGIEITLITEEETVKVRIKKPAEDTGDDDHDGADKE